MSTNVLSRFACLALVAVLPLGFVSSASAVSYNWTFTCVASDCSGSGTLDTAGVPVPSSLITSITGTMGGSVISGLLAVDAFGGNNNELYDPAGPFLLSLGGVSFQTENLSKWNIYWGNPNHVFTDVPFLSEGGVFTISQITPAETPLPGALPLFASTFGIAGLFMWRRKRRDSTSASAETAV